MNNEMKMLTLKASKQLSFSVTNYGARLMRASYGNRQLILGYDSPEDYLSDEYYYGATVGRYAGRIKDAAFTLNGQRYALSRGDDGNYLHGSFHRRYFTVKSVSSGKIELFLLSPTGEDGFPGSVEVTATYEISGDNELTVVYEAETDRETPINLTAHPYFNLSGDKSIEEHELFINASHFLELDERLCPTGQLLPCRGAFDFTKPKRIGRDIALAEEQLAIGAGYDHCYVLEKSGAGCEAELAATACCRDVRLSLATTQPGLQFYSGNYVGRTGFCLEPQHFPDSPNRAQFPSTLLKPGERYHQAIVYRFELADESSSR